ncbi:hypothetical protein DJ017_19805 [Phenylobacterium soli]|uniref:Uncharacterized protein n=1 Tax=Phenylobacterium soli TaxID=2170551 RepID=A0A328A9L0_9CAUL|nr:hypothetical protein DJ017_19805 [Phenylobacterium soli]
MKAQWADLKPEVQQAFHKLEDTVQNAKAEWGRKGERLNRYDEIMAPRKDKLDLQGVDEFTFLKTLCAAQDYLERDPVGGIQYLARSYGVDLRQFGGGQSPQLTGAEGQQAPTAQPEFAAVLTPLQQQVQALQQQLQQFSQHSEAEKLAQAQAEVDAFAANPANIYFENVRPMVAKYLETGQAQTLQDAYDMAVWAHPETREILIQAQTQNAAKATQEAQAKKAQEEQQKAKAQAAAKAAGSVTGAPTPGASAPAPGSTGNLREDLLAAKRLVESRA